jgi:hypothetical protein
VKPERVYGVDFSGAANAGRKIWIAGGSIVGETFKFEVGRRIADAPSYAPERERALAALRRFVTREAPCVVGLDFPFGLPLALVGETRWEDFALNFGDRFADAAAFRRTCQEATGGKELKRTTDLVAGTPFSPYNLRLYRQTYYGIRDVLAPLVRSGRASVLPMQPAVPERAWLVEVCPASTLKRLGLGRPYKDRKGQRFRAAREDLLAEIARLHGIEVPNWLRVMVRGDNDGDALDSVIAAVTTYRALRTTIGNDVPAGPSLIEGHVYV